MQNKTIWVVDDDDAIREVVEIILQEENYIVETMSNERELFIRLQNQKPVVILLDILLSGSDGIEIAKKIKNNPETASIPVIMMSADTQIEKKYEEAGANGFIKKPFDITELTEMIERYMKSE